jgi:hypothetical protein
VSMHIIWVVSLELGRREREIATDSSSVLSCNSQPNQSSLRSLFNTGKQGRFIPK